MSHFQNIEKLEFFLDDTMNEATEKLEFVLDETQYDDEDCTPDLKDKEFTRITISTVPQSKANSETHSESTYVLKVTCVLASMMNKASEKASSLLLT